MEQKQIKCPKCFNGFLKLRKGAKGEFLGCSTYPECKYTENGEKGAVMAPKAENKGYHLTPEQVRMNALDIALRLEPNLSKATLSELKVVAEDIEAWMLR